ncbi:MAG: right-handed parallel beta-helix repeat-containing protein [Anaerolineae bacterium]|nr:right-handed parallel beta-helix repeat-containing protein [Anaerolineae bacterium]
MIGLVILVTFILALASAVKRACRVPQRVVVRHVAVVPLIVLVLALLWLAPPRTASADPGTYYVSTNGSDSNPGTEAQPFRTISKGITVLGPGDTLYLRAGTYSEQFTLSTSGTADRPITIAAYPGEHPIIDGYNQLPGDYYRMLIVLSGNYLILDGLEIQNINGTAIQIRGSYNTVRNAKIHHCTNKAVLIGGTGYCSGGVTNSHNVIEDNEVWMTSLIHQNVNTGGKWAGAISAARCPSHTTIRRNIVHETWGIGIQVYEGYDTIIEDNITWNNQLEHFYVNNAPRTLVQRNLAYNTPDSIFLFKDMPGTTFAFCDERAEPVTTNVTIINNLSLGGNRGFYFYNQQSGSGLKQFLIANNTFVNSRIAGIQIASGSHENSRIYNNIFLETGTVAIVPNDPDLDFSHNLWAKAPSAAASSPHDVITDPRLAQSGSTDPGLLNPDWFRLSSDSPAIDAGLTSSEVPDDFDGVPRPQGAGYDIGAYEYGERTPPLQPQVYHVATTGHDSNPGTEAQPFRTISKGISVLGPGDTLYVKAGTYAENLSSFPSGTSWDAPVTIAAYPGDEVIVRPSSGSHAAYFTNAHHVILDGFVFDGANVGYNVIEITSEAHHTRIQNSEITGGPESGILVSGASDSNEFLYLDIHDNGTDDFGHGIYIESSNNLIDHCSVHHNAGWGVHIYNGHSDGYANNNIVSNNRLYDNASAGNRGPGILLGSGNGNRAYNNLIWGNVYGIQISNDAENSEAYNNTIYNNQVGIFVYAASDSAILRNNIIYQNHDGAITDLGSGTVQDHNFATDPGFVNESGHDFHLQPTSPAINAGIALGEVTEDLDGVARPQGAGYDIGAYEYLSYVYLPACYSEVTY